jgi:hypothetical protein
MKKSLDTITTTENYLQTVLSNSNLWKLRLGRIFGFFPVISFFSWKLFIQENPHFQNFVENNAKQVDVILLASILLMLIVALSVGSIKRSTRVHFARNKMFVLTRGSFRIEDISNFRIRDAGEGKHEVIFSYSSGGENVSLLTNLCKHEAEKALFWLKESMNFEIRQSIISQQS